ncbi:MAG: methionyl-tRNA synthetase [Thermotogota bacterium]|nr:methionyl-tRNA synthetase [Thermotogota bacterium]MDK2865262.1 methionyl-tRNA synthetase [Thermotogota bacterium]HCZ06775.1 methionine--tRNA ligase [Thermotogota bacterium]
MGKFYVTTPIYYINSEPHIGSAYTTIVADVIARYRRFLGDDVFFLTGTDEHGQKVYNAAKEAGKDTHLFCDELAEKFRTLWKDLKITNDGFIRTTDPQHMKTVQYFVKKMVENGDVYKGVYRGWYCVPCESYWSDDELLDGNTCPSCGRPVKRIEEENYFFRLSKYRDPLLKHFMDNPEFVEPDFRRNEMLKILEGGLKDVSITRTTFSWGVPMPDAPGHVIYVWIDALINYVSAIGYPHDMETFDRYWPADVHLIGKEINRFHSIIWPAMLMSVGLPLPKKVYAHGWLTVNGQKISKSLGNAIDPRRLTEAYGNDAIRYYLLRDIVFGRDGDFSEENLITRINADLANDLGNLVHRTTAMVVQNFGRVPSPGPLEGPDEQLRELVKTTISLYHDGMTAYRFTQALENLWELIRFANKYIDLTEPWKLAKIPEKKERLGSVLYNLLETIRIVSLMLLPIMPDTSEEIRRRLSVDEKPAVQQLEWGLLKAGNPVIHGEPLFKRIDSSKWERVIKTPQENVQKEMKSMDLKKERDDLITIDEFKKVKLRVARVLSAERIQNSRKLLKLKVYLGEELGERQIVAGIAKHYEPEELVGKLIIVVENLQPARLMGEESRGMLLAASKDNVLKVLTVDGDIEPGAEVS